MDDVLSAERFGFLLGQIEGRAPSPIDMANGSELIRSHETLRALLAEKDAEIAALKRDAVKTFVAVLAACGGSVEVSWGLIEKLSPDTGFGLIDDAHRRVRTYRVSP